GDHIRRIPHDPLGEQEPHRQVQIVPGSTHGHRQCPPRPAWSPHPDLQRLLHHERVRPHPSSVGRDSRVDPQHPPSVRHPPHSPIVPPLRVAIADDDPDPGGRTAVDRREVGHSPPPDLSNVLGKGQSLTVTAPVSPRPSAAYLVPAFGVLAMIWGTSFLFIKVGVRELHPAYVTLTRVALGAVTILILLAVLRQKLPRSPRIWAHLAVAGAIGVALPFTLYGYGEQRVPSLLAGIWNATTPLATLPLAVLLFRTERFTARKLLGLAIGFAGVLVVLGVWTGVGGSALTGQLM